MIMFLFRQSIPRGIFRRKIRVLLRQNVLKVHSVCIPKHVTVNGVNSNMIIADSAPKNYFH